MPESVAARIKSPAPNLIRQEGTKCSAWEKRSAPKSAVSFLQIQPLLCVQALQDQQEHPRDSRQLRHRVASDPAADPALLQHHPESGRGRQDPQPQGHLLHDGPRPLNRPLHRPDLLPHVQGDQPAPGTS